MLRIYRYLRYGCGISRIQKIQFHPRKYRLSEENCTDIPGRRRPDRAPDRAQIAIDNIIRHPGGICGQAYTQPVTSPVLRAWLEEVR
jgi:hypothetical protein